MIKELTAVSILVFFFFIACWFIAVPMIQNTNIQPGNMNIIFLFWLVLIFPIFLIVIVALILFLRREK